MRKIRLAKSVLVVREVSWVMRGLEHCPSVLWPQMMVCRRLFQSPLEEMSILGLSTMSVSLKSQVDSLPCLTILLLQNYSSNNR